VDLCSRVADEDRDSDRRRRNQSVTSTHPSRATRQCSRLSDSVQKRRHPHLHSSSDVHDKGPITTNARPVSLPATEAEAVRQANGSPAERTCPIEVNVTCRYLN